MQPLTDTRPAPLPVTVTRGRLPTLWTGSALFFADLYAIFYGEPEKTRQLQTSVVGFYAYGGRLLPILNLLYGGGHNTLLLQEAPDPVMFDYFACRLGLNLPDVMVLDHHDHDTFHDALAHNPQAMDTLTQSKATYIDGYVTDPHLEALAEGLGKRVVNSTAQSKAANNKVALFRFLEADDLPRFDGGEVAPGAPLNAALSALKAQGYHRAVVRSAWGASGFGVAVVPLDGQLIADSQADLPGHLLAEPTVLVQGWVEPGVLGIGQVSSPSVQFFIGDDHIALFDVTGQLLKDASIHQGNISPPNDFAAEPEVMDDIIHQATQVTRWVASSGYRGTGSIDYIIYRQGDQTQVRVCEVNARVTGATYPSLLAKRLRPGAAWLMRNFEFAPEIDCDDFLNSLDRPGYLYRPGMETGVLPINFIRNPHGKVVKCQLLFLAASPKKCQQLITPCLTALPAKGGYASD